MACSKEAGGTGSWGSRENNSPALSLTVPTERLPNPCSSPVVQRGAALRTEASGDSHRPSCQASTSSNSLSCAVVNSSDLKDEDTGHLNSSNLPSLPWSKRTKMASNSRIPPPLDLSASLVSPLKKKSLSKPFSHPHFSL